MFNWQDLAETSGALKPKYLKNTGISASKWDSVMWKAGLWSGLPTMQSGMFIWIPDRYDLDHSDTIRSIVPFSINSPPRIR